MLSAIKHLIILGVIFFTSLYLHSRFAAVGIEYGNYKVIVSPGVLFFLLLYLLLLLLLLYLFTSFIIGIPQRWRTQRQCIRCEHGMIALVEAFMGILAENLSTTKMFYGKARSLLGDIPEVIAIKAFALLMEQKKEKAYMEFAKLLNYRDTRLLAIKCLSAHFSNLSLDNVVGLANKSMPTTYQPVWFKIMLLEAMMRQKEWERALDYINDVNKNIREHFLQHKAQCLYQVGVLWFNQEEFRKAENLLREAIQCVPGNIELAIQYARVLSKYAGIDKAKKFLIEEYRQYKAESLVNELLGLAALEGSIEKDYSIMLYDVLQINSHSQMANTSLFEAAIADRRYSDAEVYVNNMLKTADSMVMGQLLQLRLFLFTEVGEKSVSIMQCLESLIDRQKSQVLQETKSNLFNYNALEIV